MTRSSSAALTTIQLVRCNPSTTARRTSALASRRSQTPVSTAFTGSR